MVISKRLRTHPCYPSKDEPDKLVTVRHTVIVGVAAFEVNYSMLMNLCGTSRTAIELISNFE